MSDKEKKSGLKKFFQENRSLAFTIPIFIILIVVVVLVYVFTGRDTAENDKPAATQPTQTVQPADSTPEPTPAATDSDSTEVTTLPQDEREKDDSEITRNPFAEPYKVSGIIYDEKGGSIAIIEAENKTFIVEAGDEAGEYFKVISIEAKQVVLEIEGREVTLSLSGN